MASIADVFFTAYIEDKGLQADVQRIGDKAGQSLGQRMAGGLQRNSRALGAFGAAAGLAFSAASESAIVFEDQLRTIQTVVPDIDIDKLGQDIKSLAAETGKTTDDLTAGFYDLVSAGVDADDAINVLRDSAKFATGALGSTAESVDLVTSVMNAYGLEAKDSARITDVFAKAVADGKVTASELGQSIATVAPLAAQMGVSMEEVSASAAVLTAQGFSAGEAFTNMRQAMSALLTPNVTLNKLQEETGKNFADIAREKGLAVALEEVRLATKGNNDEFGKALGSTQALSFALATTGENYDAFGNQVTETFDTTGLATEQYNIKSQSMAEQAKRTAAVLNNLALDAGKVVAPFGQLFFAANQMAPAFRGLISPAKVLGTVFGGLLGKGVSSLAGLFQDISLGRRTGLAGAINRAGAFVGRTFSLAVTAATKIADAVAGLFNRLPGSGVIKGAVAKAGAAIGAVFSGAMFAAQKLSSAIVAGFNALPGSSAVKGAASKAGTFLGTTLGKAAALAFAGILLAIVIEEFNKVQAEILRLQGQIGEDVAAQIAMGTTAQLEQSKAALEAGIAELSNTGHTKISDMAAKAIADLQAQLTVVTAELERRGGAMGPALGKGIEEGAPDATAAAKDLAEGLVKAGFAIADEAEQWGRDAVEAHANALRGGWDSVQSAWDSLKDAMKDPMSRAKRIAELEGILSSKKLAKGLRSNDPLIKADAEALRIIVEDELELLRDGAEDAGEDGGKGFAKGLRLTRPQARDAAYGIGSAVASVLDRLNLYDEGRNAGGDFASGLQSQTAAVAAAASNLAKAAAQYLQFDSPAERGPFSEGGGPEGWGAKGAAFWAEGFGSVDPSGMLRRFAESARNALAAPLAGASLPIAASVGATGVAGGGIGGLTVNGGIHVNVAGGANPAETGAAVRQGIGDAMADILRSQTARLPTGTRA